MTKKYKPNKYDLLNRVVLAQAFLWIENHTEARDGELPDICYKIRRAGHSSLHINRFSSEEAIELKELTDSDEFKPIKETDISLIVMALEVMRIWITDISRDKRPCLNIADRKLLMGKNIYFAYMIKVKKTNPDIYQDQKDIIDRTTLNAQLWYNFMREKLIEGEDDGILIDDNSGNSDSDTESVELDSTEENSEKTEGNEERL